MPAVPRIPVQSRTGAAHAPVLHVGLSPALTRPRGESRAYGAPGNHAEPGCAGSHRQTRAEPPEKGERGKEAGGKVGVRPGGAEQTPRHQRQACVRPRSSSHWPPCRPPRSSQGPGLTPLPLAAAQRTAQTGPASATIGSAPHPAPFVLHSTGAGQFVVSAPLTEPGTESCLE